MVISRPMPVTTESITAVSGSIVETRFDFGSCRPLTVNGSMYSAVVGTELIRH